MSNQNEILSRLTDLFNQVFEGELQTEGLTLESRLVEDLGMNSVALLYMALAVEGEFGVKFTNEDFATLRTVGDVVGKLS